MNVLEKIIILTFQYREMDNQERIDNQDQKNFLTQKQCKKQELPNLSGRLLHGVKVKNRTRPTQTPTIDSIENLTIADLESESGKAFVETANEQLKQVDWQQMFL